MTREGRGHSLVIMFEGKTPLPAKFREIFLKKSHNKNCLNSFLADKIFSFNNELGPLIITKDTMVLTNQISIADDETLTHNYAEEADQKIARHMIQCVKSGLDHVVVRTVDTDVIMSLLAYRHYPENLDCAMFALMAAGMKKVCYDITKVAHKLGKSICQGLPFFYGLSGCDISSFFFNQGKCKFWDRWMDFDDFEGLTEVFVELSAKPQSVSTDQLDIIEKYVCQVYYGDSSEPIDTKRMKDFEHSTHGNLRLLPPSRSGLMEHVKRSAYYAGWINH